MSGIVVDASVAAKWFLTEENSNAATRLLHLEHALLGPELLMVETAAAIVRQFRKGGLAAEPAARLLADVHGLFSARSVTLVSDSALLPRAESIAIQLRHPLQDCLYVACAESAGAELVTTDAALIKRAAPQFPFVRSL